MKDFKLILILCIIICVIPISCKKEITCLEGEVIGYEKCEKATLIRIVNVNSMGNKISYHNDNGQDTIYENVIKTPNLYPLGKIYFNYRKYDAQKDSHLFQFNPAQICLAVYGPYNVPIIVVTNFSQTNCP